MGALLLLCTCNLLRFRNLDCFGVDGYVFLLSFSFL
uniref:Uncharacterized protein n=1 Tax=Octopus bimaculoides TaxID=37653 RepID=A0A0L8FY21_OCTBM